MQLNLDNPILNATINRVLFPIKTIVIEKKAGDIDVHETRCKLIEGSEGDPIVTYKLANGVKIEVKDLNDLWITRDMQGNPRNWLLPVFKIGNIYQPLCINADTGSLETRYKIERAMKQWAIGNKKIEARYTPPNQWGNMVIPIILLLFVGVLGYFSYMGYQEIGKIAATSAAIAEDNRHTSEANRLMLMYLFNQSGLDIKVPLVNETERV